MRKTRYSRDVQNTSREFHQGGSAEEEVPDERDRARSPFGSFGGGGGGGPFGSHSPLGGIGIGIGMGTSPTNKELIADQSTCSDGSLLSMGSSDLDEDSCGQSSSRHSSKLSLQDKRTSSADGGDLEVRVSTTPLSHSAARHKMAVKPKRTHGAPRRRRIQQLSAPALPATPELNEEPTGAGRSLSPEPREVSPSNRLALQRGPPYALGLGPHAGSGPGLVSGKGPGVVTVTRSRSSATGRQEHEQTREHGAGAARRSGSSDQLDRHEQRREQQETKAKKEDLSFFGRLLSRRSGKKKKGERAPGQPPAPVLPPSAATATSASAPVAAPTANAYYSVYAAKDAVDSAVAPSLPMTRRLDDKGRYVAEAEVESTLVPPGALSSHFLSGAGARARQRLEPMTIPAYAHDADRTPEGGVDALLPRTTTPLDGVPVPVKPEPTVAAAAAAATRMQASFSTSSPPAPLWPAGDTKVVELIEKTPEARSLFEQEKEKEGRLRSTRLPGLSAFQQRVAQVGDDAARDLSSLGEDVTRPVQRRRLSSGRADFAHSYPQSQPPSLPAGLGVGRDKEKDVLAHFDEEMTSASLTASEGEDFSGAPDSLEPQAAAESSAQAPASRPDPGAFPAPSPAPAPILPLAQQEAPPRSCGAAVIAFATAPRLPEYAIGAKGKSSSIESLGPVSPPPPPLLPKASSSDSITLTAPAPALATGMHQVTIPLGSSGLSITQRVADTRPASAPAPAEPVERAEPHSVTVACVPDPAPAPAPTSAPAPITASTATTPSPSSTPSPLSSAAAAAVTLVNLPSPTETPTVSSTDEPADSPPDTPTNTDRTVVADRAAEKPLDRPADKPDKDKTERSADLPTEGVLVAPPPPRPSSCVVPPPSVVPTPGPGPLVRKSLPPMPVAAEESTNSVPEFMRVQLNRVDSKPSVNVVLSTGVPASPERASPERVSLPGRVSTGTLDPWSVEEVVQDVPLLQVSAHGLRPKRASSKDDLIAAGKDVAADAGGAGMSSLPASPPKPRTTPTPPPMTTAPMTAAAAPQSLLRKQQPHLGKRVPCLLGEDNNNVIIVEKKDKPPADIQPPTPPSPQQQQQQQDDAAVVIRKKSASRDSLQLQWQSSLEERGQRSRDSSVSPVLDGVVLRRKSLPRDAVGKDQPRAKDRDDTPELMKVFARRSLKVRDSEADLTLPALQPARSANVQPPVQGPGSEHAAAPPLHRERERAGRDSDKENESEGAESPASSPKEERAAVVPASSRFQRSPSLPSQPPQQPPQPQVQPQVQPQQGRPSALVDKPVMVAKPATATDTIIGKDSNSNRLRVRKPDNGTVVTNGTNNNNNNININNNFKTAADKTPPSTTPVAAPASSVVAKMSARWTLPAEARPTPVMANTPPVGGGGGVADCAVVEAEANVNNAVPKFKRIQQRREEWEQRAKALQRAAQ